MLGLPSAAARTTVTRARVTATKPRRPRRTRPRRLVQQSSSPPPPLPPPPQWETPTKTRGPLSGRLLAPSVRERLTIAPSPLEETSNASESAYMEISTTAYRGRPTSSPAGAPSSPSALAGQLPPGSRPGQPSR